MLRKKTRSSGANVAGMLNNLENNSLKRMYSFSVNVIVGLLLFSIILYDSLSLYYFAVLVLGLTRSSPRHTPRDQDQDSTPRDQDQDSNPRDQDQDQDSNPRDQDQDQDSSPRDQDQDQDTKKV